MTLPVLLLLCLAVGWAVPHVAVRIAMRRAKRAQLRPIRDDCAHCSEYLAPFEYYWLEGKRICPTCAQRMGRRLRFAAWTMVSILGLFGMTGMVGAILMLARGDPEWWMAFTFIEGCTLVLAVLFVGAMRTMKWENATGRQFYAIDLRLRHLFRTLGKQ